MTKRNAYLLSMGYCLVFGLAVSILDLGLNLISEKLSDLSSLPLVCLVISTSTVFFFLISLAGWTVLSRLLALSGQKIESLAVPSAVFVGVYFLLLSSFGLTSLSGLRDTWYLPVVFLVIALSPAVAVYIALRARKDDLKAERRLSLAMLIASTVFFLAVWLNGFVLERKLDVYFISGLVLCCLLAFALVLFFPKRKPLLSPVALGIAIAFMLLSGAAVELFSPSDGLLITDQAKSTKRSLPPVIFISIDALRADALSCLGGDKATATPNIDKIAADGILFSRAFSASSWTLPSVVSFQTGLNSVVHKVSDKNPSVPNALVTLAERLKSAGYLNAAVGFNWFLRRSSNLNQGFDGYQFETKHSPGVSLGGKLLKRVLLPKRFGFFVTDEEITEKASAWLTRNSQQQFFLWIHYFDPHAPYDPPPETVDGSPPAGLDYVFSEESARAVCNGETTLNSEQKQWLKKLYLGDVRETDATLGALIGVLCDLNIYKDAIIVVTSDHGEEFWDHNGMEHGHTLYNEIIHVPLIIKLPGNQYAGTRLADNVSTTSIVPTILELCRSPAGAGNFSTPSLVSLWKSPGEPHEDTAILSFGTLYGTDDPEAVIFKDSKYIYKNGTKEKELYNLDADFLERTNLVAPKNDALVQALDNRMRSTHRRALEQRNRLGIQQLTHKTLSEEDKEKLRQLGYIL